MSPGSWRFPDSRAVTFCSVLILLLFLPITLAAVPHIYYDDLGFTHWRPSWAATLQESLATGKPMYIQYTHLKCPLSPLFCKSFLSDIQVQNTLRRYYVCFAVDYYQAPQELLHELKKKGYTDEQTPVHLLLSPQKEVLAWYVKCLASDQFANDLKKIAADKRFAMPKQLNEKVDKLVADLQQAIEQKDAGRIAQLWQKLTKTAGNSVFKDKGFALMESAEEPARKKLYDAAKLMREQKSPLAHVALDEAQQLASFLPISEEIRQTSLALKSYDRAVESERLATTVKQKQSALQAYQQILVQYPDTTVGTMAYQKLRSSLPSK